MAEFRVSDQTRYLGMVPSYNSLLGRQVQLQRQIASGKRWDSADQDPVGVAIAQRLHAEDARMTQDLRNGSEATAFSQAAETAVTSAVGAMQRARELAVQANDPTKTAADRQTIATEVDQILRNMIDLGGMKHRGRALFSGTQTLTNAFQAVTDAGGNITGVTYAGNGESFSTEFAPGQSIAYNMLGSNENGGNFGLMRDTAAGVDVFQTLITFRDNLSANPAALDTDLRQITGALSHLTEGAARLGGVQGRLAAAVSRIEDHQQVLIQALSKLEDTDIASAIMELNQLQTAYQASLSVGAKIGQMSLLNYLR